MLSSSHNWQREGKTKQRCEVRNRFATSSHLKTMAARLHEDYNTYLACGAVVGLALLPLSRYFEVVAEQ